jgi:LPS export ABC transporter protein LptC
MCWLRKRKFLFALCICVLFMTCEEEEREMLGEEPPKITLERFTLTETKMGKKLWMLEGQQARVYTEIIKVDSITIHFFDQQEVKFSILHAPAGILNTKTHNVLVGDTVAVLTNDSTQLFTDSLFWFNDSQLIITNRPVTIYKKDSTVIEGRGLRADPYLEKIEIFGETKGVSPFTLPDIKK